MLSIKCGLLLAQLATGTDHFTDHAVIKGDKVEKDSAVMIFNSLLVSAAQHVNENTAVTDDYAVEVSDEDFKRLVFGSTSAFVATLKNGEFYVEVDAKELRLVADKEVRHIVSTQLLPQFADWLDMKLGLNATKQSTSQTTNAPDFGAYVVDTDLGIYEMREPGLAKARVLQEHKRNENAPPLPASAFQNIELIEAKITNAEQGDSVRNLFEINCKTAVQLQQRLNKIFLGAGLSNVVYADKNIVESVNKTLSQHLEGFGTTDDYHAVPKNPVDELFAAYGSNEYMAIPMQLRKIIELAMSVSFTCAEHFLRTLKDIDPDAPKQENLYINDSSALLGLKCFTNTVDYILQTLPAAEQQYLNTVGVISTWDKELKDRFAKTIDFILKKRVRNVFIDRFNVAFAETLQFYGLDQVVESNGVNPSKHGHYCRHGDTELMISMFDLPCYRNIVKDLSSLYIHLSEMYSHSMVMTKAFEESFGAVFIQYPISDLLSAPELLKNLIEITDKSNFEELAAMLDHADVNKTISFIGTDVIGRLLHNVNSKYRYVWTQQVQAMREQVCKEIELQINDSLRVEPDKSVKRV